jgi:hypothetical protein
MDIQFVTVFRILCSIASFAVIIATAIPYSLDIARGTVRPARSTRWMMLLLMSVALAQQISGGATWEIGLTVGEVIASLVLAAQSITRGVGGWSRDDIICYSLSAVDLVLWLTSHDALLALHLTIIADMIAFAPTLIKTWRDPSSESALFYWGGVIAPIGSIIASSTMSYSSIVFPAYVAIANFVEVALIQRSGPVPSKEPR